MSQRCPLLVPTMLLLLAAARAQQQPLDAPDFDREVRPILADRCFPCHGPDAGKRKAGLRLDVEDGSRATLESGERAIVPGDPANSELVRRIRSVDPEYRMPRPESKLALSDAERDVLERWIASGAAYRTHWAWRPLPDLVPVPAVDDARWPRNAIDSFVLARLRTHELVPAPEAPRARLLRRASFALTGLPPEPDDVIAFERDDAPDAFERAVDRLLGSVAYAEHMTADWLDAARFADTWGYQSDVHREVWPWRDQVIRAFDRNLPYDEFLRQQLAGDLLPSPTRESALATAFLRLHRMTNEGGSVEEEYRVESVCDRVETIGTAILGVTLGCAKCHDHKYDPFTQRDYYGLSALLDDADEAGLYSHFTDATPTPALWLPTADQERELARATRRIGELEHALRIATARRADAFAAWLGALTDPPALTGASGVFGFESIAADGTLDDASGHARRGRTAEGPTLGPGAVGQALQLDGENNASFPGAADFTRDDPFTIACFVRVTEHHDRAVIWHRSRAWTDAGSRGYELLLEDGRLSAALIHFWPGNALRVVAREPLPIGRFVHVAARYEGSSRAAGLSLFVDGVPVATDVVRDALTREIEGGGADALTLGQRFRDKGLRGAAIDELAVVPRALAGLEIAELAAPGALREAFAHQNEAPQRGALREVFLASHDQELTRLRGELRDARRARSAIVGAIREIVTMRDDVPVPRIAYRLERGNYERRAEPVEPAAPAAILPWPKGAPRNRLGLAQWLLDPRHPLTARVAVNRIWQMHFGRGLVPTSEDFGTQGQRPVHPELLDWLARRFVDSGWDLKALHRLIVTSSTWRQDSRCAPTLRELDPDNELLARGASFRLAAEAIRDGALFASGLLVREVGGPSVKPYQPPGLWEEKSGTSYQEDPGKGLWRRSLYTYQKRTSPPPAMTTLDAGSREVCSVRRQRTSNPLQALLLMNDPQHVETARSLAQRTLHETVDRRARIERMVRRVIARAPSPGEVDVMLEAVAEERARFAAEPAAALALCSVGKAPRDESLDVTELAAWTALASTLFSLDEAVTLR
ncbi:MAG: DUF1553 domain-containing protein [Planctomycetes bacterium]|nr:DUF1553 domain-containing protein [Planctomycetota bacterium]